MLIILFIWVILELEKTNPIFGLYVCSKIQTAFTILRISYFTILGSLVFFNWVGNDIWLYYLFQFTSDFGLDITSLPITKYSFDSEWSLVSHVSLLLESVFPLVYADEINIDLIDIHPSFKTIALDTTKGGLLIQDVLKHIVQQNKLNIPIFLSSLGITETHKLISMLNYLPINGVDSMFVGDNKLLEYLTSAYKSDYYYNMELDLSSIHPIVSYTLPLTTNVEPIANIADSGVYAFVHSETSSVGIGSAVSCRSRLIDHMRSFEGNRDKTYLHTWINDHGGIDSVRWAPIITMSNIEMPLRTNLTIDTLSVGGSKILRAFAQYPIRVLEQCIMTHYSPSLNPIDSNVIFF